MKKGGQGDRRRRGSTDSTPLRARIHRGDGRAFGRRGPSPVRSAAAGAGSRSSACASGHDRTSILGMTSTGARTQNARSRCWSGIGRARADPTPRRRRTYTNRPGAWKAPIRHSAAEPPKEAPRPHGWVSRKAAAVRVAAQHPHGLARRPSRRADAQYPSGSTESGAALGCAASQRVARASMAAPSPSSHPRQVRISPARRPFFSKSAG